MAEFLEELAAMATGGGGDGEGDKGGAFVDGEVGEKGLFCVDRMVEWKRWEFEVYADVNTAISAESHSGDMEVGDRWSS